LLQSGSTRWCAGRADLRSDHPRTGDSRGNREGLGIVATLIGAGFLVYAAVAVLNRTLYDVDDGYVDRAARPIAFWLLVSGMTILGLVHLGRGLGVADRGHRGAAPCAQLTSREVATFLIVVDGY
jgi:hypothetical protein